MLKCWYCINVDVLWHSYFIYFTVESFLGLVSFFQGEIGKMWGSMAEMLYKYTQLIHVIYMYSRQLWFILNHNVTHSLSIIYLTTLAYWSLIPLLFSFLRYFFYSFICYMAYVEWWLYVFSLYLFVMKE